MSIYLSSPKFSKAYNFIILGKGSFKKKWEFSHSEQGPPTLQKVGKHTFFYLIYRFQKVFLCKENFPTLPMNKIKDFPQVGKFPLF